MSFFILSPLSVPFNPNINIVASQSLSRDYSAVSVMDFQFEPQLQEMLKTFKTSQTLTKSEQDMLRKVSSNQIQLENPKLPVYISPYSSICPNRLFEFRLNKICRSTIMKKQILRIILHPSNISTSPRQSFQFYGRSWFLCGSWLLCGAPS